MAPTDVQSVRRALAVGASATTTVGHAHDSFTDFLFEARKQQPDMIVSSVYQFTCSSVHALAPTSASPLWTLTTGVRSWRRGRHVALVGHDPLALHLRRTVGPLLATR